MAAALTLSMATDIWSQQTSVGANVVWLGLGGGFTNVVSASGYGVRVEHIPSWRQGTIGLAASYGTFEDQFGVTPEIQTTAIDVSLIKRASVLRPYLKIGVGAIRFDTKPNEFPVCNAETGLPENCERFEDDTAPFLSPGVGSLFIVTHHLQARVQLEMMLKHESETNSSSKPAAASAGLEYRF